MVIKIDELIEFTGKVINKTQNELERPTAMNYLKSLLD